MSWTANKQSISTSGGTYYCAVQYSNGAISFQEAITIDAASYSLGWPDNIIQQRLIALNSTPSPTTGVVSVSPLLNVIANEITNDPTVRGYAGKTPTQIAILMNVVYTPNGAALGSTFVPFSKVVFLLILLGKWEGIKLAHDNPGATGHTDAFKIYEMALLPDFKPDYTQAAFATILNNLVTAALLSAGDATAIKNLTTSPQQSTRCIDLGLPSVSAMQVAAAQNTVIS